jgi:superkiller protein 3
LNGNYPEAIKSLQIASKEGFMNANSWNLLGSAFFKTENYQDAIKAFNKSIELQPDDEQVLINLGSVYGTIGNFEKAIQCMSKALEINPYNQRAMQYLSMIYGEIGDRKNADLYLDKMNRLQNPNR